MSQSLQRGPRVLVDSPERRCEGRRHPAATPPQAALPLSGRRRDSVRRRGHRRRGEPNGPQPLQSRLQGSGTAQIAQYIDDTRPDTKPNWDVYYKHVDWTITWHVTIEGGAITQIGNTDAQVSGSGRALIRSNPSS